MSGQPLALWTALPGVALPMGWETYWEESGFAPHIMPMLEDWDGTRAALSVLWVGRQWERGLEALVGMSEQQRDLALLLGEDMPSDFVAQVRDQGGWWAASWPPNSWIAPAARGAVERSRVSLPASLTLSLQSLEPGMEEQAPEAILVRAAELAGKFLRSDLVLPVYGTVDSSWVLTKEESGIALEAWHLVAKRFDLPAALPVLAAQVMQGARRTRRIRAFPTPQHLPVDIRPIVAPSFQSHVWLPVKAQKGGIAGQPKPLFASILLFWREPHLLRMSELVPLKILRAFAATALARLAERARLTNRHNVTIRAQSEYYGISELGRGPWLVRAEGSQILLPILRAYSGLTGLQEVWTQVAESSRGQARWFSLGAPSGAQTPPVVVGEDIQTRLLDIGDGSGRWALSRLVGQYLPGLGQVVAVFESRELALAGRPEVESLTADLELAARLLRRERVNTSLAKLSSSDLRPEAPSEEFLSIADEVRDCLDADGAKILVLRRHAGERKIWQVCNTAARDKKPGMIPFNPEGHGLANWVLKNGKWLLIPKRDPRQTEIVDEEAITEAGEPVKVRAFKERVFFEDGQAPGDHEWTMLWMPLKSQGKVSGVVAVWREEPTPFDGELDVESLSRFAPHVAAACQRLLQLEKARDELKATADLAKSLDQAEDLGQAYLAVAEGAGQLADAACALLLHHDPSRFGCLSLSAVRAAGGQKDRERWSAQVGRLHIDGAHPISTWEGIIDAELRQRLTGLRLRALLVPSGDEQQPSLALALLDLASTTSEPLFFSDDLLEHFTRSFLESASALVRAQVPSLASRLFDKLGSALATEKRTHEGILRNAANLLLRATGAEAVLYYIGNTSHIRPLGAIPANESLRRFAVIPGSETEKSLIEKKPKRLLDVVHASHDLHKDRLREISNSFGRGEIGSWLSCPVVHDGRCRGLIKLLTFEHGGFFTADHELLAWLVAERAALEMYKASRGLFPEDLLRISRDVASNPPDRLGELMAEKLRAWVEDQWMRPKCTVAVIARTQSGKALVTASAPELADDGLQLLEDLSEQWHSKGRRWPTGAANEIASKLAPYGLAEPFQKPALPLEGHLVLIDNELFAPEDQEAWQLAAAYMAVLLDGERERQEEREKMGRFRHAALGPIQGLTSSAKLLAQLAAKAGVNPAMLRRLQGSVETEAETLRLWREHQRFYLYQTVEIRPQRQALRPVVERCVERFRIILQERGIMLRLTWPPAVNVTFPFDAQAFDLVLSNLLDNARKYSFYNREVTVGVRVKDDTITVWVEDIGHGIPDERREEIYQLGKRVHRQDPLRSIAGEGLGLAMCKAIVEEHGGRIYHNSRLIGQAGKIDLKTPYLVRFTVELPRKEM